MKKSTGLVLILAALLFSLVEFKCQNNQIQEKKEVPAEPKYEYGILVDSFRVKKGVVKKGETFGEILDANHIYYALPEILLKSKDIFDFSKSLSPEKKYALICNKDSVEEVHYFIYQENHINYIVVDLKDTIEVYKGEKEINTKVIVSHGEIASSLSEAIDELGISPRVSIQLAEIYAWTIDFFKIQKGDAFKVYYENNYIDGEYIGIGKILAAEFTHKNQKFYSFYYKENDNYGEYFDQEGRTLRKAFLKAPLDFYRISSRFSRNRKHPVTGQWKGHFGTDYAAPKGTPIMTTANGTIEKAGYTKNNGNFVKVRHNSTYTTQYLHMSKIKKGIRKGVYVKQGETIGYVGSTGLATGPHVCYRFWKNGKQVDPYKEKLPPGKPMKEESKENYLQIKDSLMQILITKKE